MVSPHVQETGRVPVRPDRIEHLVELGRQASQIWIATDPDFEGDVIAADVYALFVQSGCEAVIERVRAKGLDPDSLKKAVQSRSTVHSNDRVPGDARRITDRLIGGLLSDFDRHIGVGRIQSALLGLVADQPPPAYQLALTLKSSQRGPPFQAVVELAAGQEALAKEWLRIADQAKAVEPDVEDVFVLSPEPLEGGTGLLQVSRDTGLPIPRVARAFQRLYEHGKMSYPRTDSQRLSRRSARSLQRLADQYGVPFHADQVARRAPLNAAARGSSSTHGIVQDAHEALHPLTTDVPLHRPLRSLPPEQAVLAAMVRRQIESGALARTRRQRPVRAQVPEALRELDWLRTPQIQFPWQPEQRRVPGLYRLPQDQALLARLLESGLGRPGTYVHHLEKFLSRGLIDNRGHLTLKGSRWIEHTLQASPKLLTPAAGRTVEQIVFYNDEPLAVRVRDAMRAVGLDDYETRARGLEADYAAPRPSEPSNSAKDAYTTQEQGVS